MIKILQSKFSIKQVILIPVTVILFVCFLLSILTFFSIDMTYDGTPLYKTPIWAVLIFILLLFFQIRFYLKTFKRYNFFDKGFEIRTIYGKEFYAWNVINQVSLINTPSDQPSNTIWCKVSSNVCSLSEVISNVPLIN